MRLLDRLRRWYAVLRLERRIIAELSSLDGRDRDELGIGPAEMRAIARAAARARVGEPVPPVLEPHLDLLARAWAANHG